MNSTTYECKICLSINSAARFHCQHCGTIPAEYSITREPISGSRFETARDEFSIVSVVVAFGADRAEHHRTVRTYLRTVKADYYASE
jgi:hypothetical protein